MEQDADAAGLAAVGGLDSGTHHPVEAGAPCRNRGTRVERRFCANCGQLGADFHRPIWDLVTSSIGDMFAFDGRRWRTLPALMLRPGRVTRDYIEGRRALCAAVPPVPADLRDSFLTVFTVPENQPQVKELSFAPDTPPEGEFVVVGDTRLSLGVRPDDEAFRAELATDGVSPERSAELEAALGKLEQAAEQAPMVFKPDGTVDREALRQSVIASNPGMTAA